MLHYRKEIDGLRAIAVMAVIFFHAGYLPNGYLGVDIFFVISGYLITRTINYQLVNSSFSLLQFYERRIRRIVPMLLLVTIVAIAIGYFTLLPDDLENLSESVIATSLFSNNILLFLTRNYWDKVNDFKPLMHTWSLGVEEQFYFIFPLILIGLHKLCKRETRVIIICLLIFTSFISNLIISKSSFHFFSVTSRFYQFALGALIAGITKPTFSSKTRVITNTALISILIILLLPYNAQPFTLSATTTILTALIIYYYYQQKPLFILENSLIVFIGKISYSLYLWHHLVFCIYRLTYHPAITNQQYLVLFSIVVSLSLITYYLIEQPFRNNKLVSTKLILNILLSTSILLISTAAWLYQKKGIVKNIPEMDIYINNPENFNSPIAYNERVYKMDQLTVSTTKKRLLVIGNSFARDFVNMLIENKYTDSFDIRYKEELFIKTNNERILSTDILIIGNAIDSFKVTNFCQTNKIEKNKILIVGTKNFGTNISWIFNTTNPNNRCTTRVAMEPNYLSINNWYKLQLPYRYIDLISLLIDKNNQVPLFTPDCKLISQDCRHLTQNGAKYLGSLLINDKCFHYFMQHLNDYAITKK